MTHDEMKQIATEAVEEATKANANPLVPGSISRKMLKAARLLKNLVDREIERNGQNQ